MKEGARIAGGHLPLGNVEDQPHAAGLPAFPDAGPLPVARHALGRATKERASTEIRPFSRKGTNAPGRPLRVLVVEDEAIIAIEIELILQELGAEVIGIAMTAAQATDLAKLHRPDCITMDISIKGDRDGVSAATEIYETLGIRSIFVSAYGNAETRERAGAAHPVGWVQKPIAPEELRTALEQVPDGD